MPARLTDITEITTALGMVAQNLPLALAHRPAALTNVDDEVWARLQDSFGGGKKHDAFCAAFGNGRAFLAAKDGLRNRIPQRVEWKGPHRAPGDDVIPADLRVDHVFLISCKYLSKVLLNPGPPRLFDRLLAGDERSSLHWFVETAPQPFQTLYEAAKSHTAMADLPGLVVDLTRAQQTTLKAGLRDRTWPETLQGPWSNLCRTVSEESARRWRSAMAVQRDQRRLLWRLLRITTATYFVLGSDRATHLRLRIDSAWDWQQAYELRAFEVAARHAGQPEVAWQATIRRRLDGAELTVSGHVEIRWSHGRFLGSPEAKVYLDTPHALVPGYNVLE